MLPLHPLPFTKYVALVLLLCGLFHLGRAQRDVPTALELKFSPERIEILRDTFGVPHISAPSDAEAAYGLAWAHAEDDFYNLQLEVAFIKGRRGELNRADAPMDYYLAYTRAREYVDSFYTTKLSPEFRFMVESYAAGLNAFAARHPDEWLLKELFPITGRDIITGYVVTLYGMVGVPRALKKAVAGEPEDFVIPPLRGSNAWAFSKRRMTDGHTHLILNPHVPVNGEHSMWEAHLKTDQGWNFCGALMQGMVSPALGANPHLAYTFTFNWPDYVDIYKLTINPKNKNQYRFNGQWRDFERRKVPLKVKVGPVKITVKREALWCVYGPAIRGKHKDSVYATAFPREVIRGAEQWYRMSKATNLQEFQDALAIQGIPLFNILYADKEDNIFYQFNGLLPKRNRAYNWQSVLPGDTSATLRGPYLPLERLPRYLNPECGYLYNTNNTPFRASGPGCNLDPSDYGPEHGYDWNHENNRDHRIRELMLGTDSLTPAFLRRMKYDAHYPINGTMRKITFQVFDKMTTTQYPELAAEIEVLRKWNFSGGADNRQTALAMLTMYACARELEVKYGGLEIGYRVPEDLFAEKLAESGAFLRKHFGALEVPWSRVQELRRGNAHHGIDGLPETLRANYAKPNDYDRLQVHTGENFIGFAVFDSTGLVSYETVTSFGQSNDPNSPHYADQLPLSATGKTKPMPLYWEDVEAATERRYHPGKCPKGYYNASRD